MDDYTKQFIQGLREVNLNIASKYYYKEDFYNKFFGDLNLKSHDLNTNLKSSLNSRTRASLEVLINLLKRNSNMWFILTPFTYFLGSIIRDFVIESSRQILWSNIIWVLVAIIVPIGLGITYRSESRGLKDYLLINQSYISSDNISKNNSGEAYNNSLFNLSNAHVTENKRNRLAELKKMLDEDLITEADYLNKKKEILRDL